MRRNSSHWPRLFGLVAVLGLAAPAQAGVRVAMEALELPGLHLEALELQLDDAPDGGLALSLKAARADLPAVGWRRLGIALDGRLQRLPQRGWALDGTLKLAGAPGAALAAATVRGEISAAANTITLDIGQGKAQAHAALPLDQPTHAQIVLDNLPAAWLQGLAGTFWSGSLKAGRLDGELALDLREDGMQASGRFAARGLGFDAPDGSLAGEALGGSGRFGVDSRAGTTSLDLDASLHGGEVLAGGLYARLPAHAVQLVLEARTGAAGIELPRLHVGDADALVLDAALAFDPRGKLRSLGLKHLHADFPAAWERYGQVSAEAFGLGGASVRGALDASLDLRSDGLAAFAFDTKDLTFTDGAGRIAVEGLRGGLDWARGVTRPATTLAWQALNFYALPFGAAETGWQSRGGSLVLRQAAAVPLLGGELRLSRLDWRPAAQRGERLNAALVLAGVDMAGLSQVFGWPAFPGTLAGAVPSLRWVDDTVQCDGGLSASLFGGFLDVTRLSLQQPLGPHPALAADLDLRGLDLAAVTGVFDFGHISGPLDATIRDLRLVDWTPVAFDARLRAEHGGRISQRAVNNLTSVGGGGVAAGLQGAMLKLFKTFGYKRIGLDCTLADGVCQMGGLDDAGASYTIVEGSGLPRLAVVGHQRQVDWPGLVHRLAEAVAGNGPEVH